MDVRYGDNFGIFSPILTYGCQIWGQFRHIFSHTYIWMSDMGTISAYFLPYIHMDVRYGDNFGIFSPILTYGFQIWGQFRHIFSHTYIWMSDMGTISAYFLPILRHIFSHTYIWMSDMGTISAYFLPYLHMDVRYGDNFGIFSPILTYGCQIWGQFRHIFSHTYIWMSDMGTISAYFLPYLHMGQFVRCQIWGQFRHIFSHTYIWMSDMGTISAYFLPYLHMDVRYGDNFGIFSPILTYGCQIRYGDNFGIFSPIHTYGCQIWGQFRHIFSHTYIWMSDMGTISAYFLPYLYGCQIWGQFRHIFSHTYIWMSDMGTISAYFLPYLHMDVRYGDNFGIFSPILTYGCQIWGQFRHIFSHTYIWMSDMGTISAYFLPYLHMDVRYGDNFGIFSPILTHGCQIWGQFRHIFSHTYTWMSDMGTISAYFLPYLHMDVRYGDNFEVIIMLRLQNRAIKILNFANFRDSSTPLYKASKILKLTDK